MAKRGYKLQELIAHASDVKCLNIGKKSCRVFISGGEDRKVNLWAIGKPNALLSLSGHTSPIESVTFDSSEAMVLAGASTGAIKLWDLADAKVVRTLSGHKSKCSSLEFHPFGEFFASGSSDTDLKIWDIRKKGCIHTYEGHTRGITTIRFTPDGRWLVSGGEDNVVKLWDLTAGKLLHDFKFHNGTVRSIDFHPHEFLLATGSADRTVKFWDLETFELIGSAGPEASGVRSMIFHPDGKTLVCGLDRMLKVFSWEPIRCHDDTDIGWSNLGDLCINEGKLLGCSYHESSVGVWVVDLSLIRPYAAGGYLRCSAFVEPEISAVNHTVNSVPACLNVCDDQKVDTKEIIHTECNTYKTEDDPGQKLYGTVSSNKAYKGSQRGSAVSKVNKDISRCVENQMVDKLSISKTTVSNLTSSINSDTREGKLVTTKVTGPVSSRKGTPVNSSGFIGGSLSDPKKESITDPRRRGNVRVNNTICTPVVVMRDTPDLPKSKLHNKTLVPDLDAHNAGLYKPSHTRRPSFVDVGIDIHPVSGNCVSSVRASDDTEDVTDLQYRPGSANAGITNSKAGNYESIKSTTETFQRVVFLDPSFSSRRETADQESICNNSKTSPLNNVKADQEPICYNSKTSPLNNLKENRDSPCSTTELKSVKYVKGVAVQHGRTKSLVESWEKREKITNSCTTTDEPSLDPNPPIVDPYIPPRQNEQIRSSERKLIYEVDDITSSLMQNRDMLINVLKSRLTKLQMVRHCWEQNGIKGAINSVAKLPDLSVQVDVISVLTEKPNLLTLDSFSCLLPILTRSLNSKTERHIDISLDMMLKLVKLFWPMVHSTMSAFSPVGVDIEAEERMTRCRQIFGQLEKIRDILPSLIRKGGLIARRSLELNLALQS